MRNLARIHSTSSFVSHDQQLVHASTSFGIRFSASADAKILDPSNPSGAMLDIQAGHIYHMAGSIVFIRNAASYLVSYEYTELYRPQPIDDSALPPNYITKIQLPASNSKLIAGTNTTTEIRIKGGVFADVAIDGLGYVPFCDEYTIEDVSRMVGTEESVDESKNLAGDPEGTDGKLSANLRRSPVLVDGNIRLKFRQSNSGGTKTTVYARYAVPFRDLENAT